MREEKKACHTVKNHYLKLCFKAKGDSGLRDQVPPCTLRNPWHVGLGAESHESTYYVTGALHIHYVTMLKTVLVKKEPLRPRPGMIRKLAAMLSPGPGSHRSRWS